ncbi:hypothetical protein ONZ45_g15221 [Pleurotus djamor]|nr:hypothetical protein ONZ45_g15221 [Pleurotus djamor]
MLGQIDTAVPMFTQLLHWYKVNDRTRILLHDGYRFVMTFMDAIKACPFQVYATGLPFSPTRSLLRIVYAHQVDDLRIANVLTALDQSWGPCLRTMESHKGGVRSVVFSHDGQWIASTGNDHLVKIWDSAVGILRRTFSGHTAMVATTVFSSDDRILFSGSSDGTIRTWNMTSGAPLNVINLDAPVDCIALSRTRSDIQRIFAICKVFGGSKGTDCHYRITFRILDTNGRALQVFTKDVHVDPGHHTHWSILDRKYFAVTARNRIVLYDSDPHSAWDAKEFVDPQGDVGDVNMFPQSDILLSGTYDGAIRLWQVETQTCIHVIKVHTGSIAVNPLKGFIASASNDSSVRLWSLQEKACVAMHPLPNHVLTMSFSPNGETLVSGDSESMLQLWDVQEQSETAPPEVTHRETPSSWVISPDGRFIAGLVPNNMTEIWSTRDDRLVASIAPYKTDLSLDSLVTSKDGIWVALLVDGRTLYLINIVTQEISYSILGLEPEGPSLKQPSPRDTIDGPQSSQEGPPNSLNGQLIYLRFSEFQEDEVEVGRWYLLNWHLREIAVVNEKDVPQEYLNPPQQRYTQQEGWLVDRQQNKHLCWLPPSFRGDHGDESCFLLEDALGSRYFSISGSHRITVVDLSKPGEEEESDGWRTVYNCIHRVLERCQW